MVSVRNKLKQDCEPLDGGDSPLAEAPRQRLAVTLCGGKTEVRDLISRLDSIVHCGQGWLQFHKCDWWRLRESCTVLIDAPSKTIKRCENMLAEFGQ